jgi:hypothetical protein
MKKLILTVSCIFFASALHIAQIPNAGFETWTNGNPDGWFTDNIPNFATPVVQSNNSHSGSLACRLEVISFGGSGFPGYIWSGENFGQGFPVPQAYGSLTGYYQFNRNGDDELYVVAYMRKGDDYIGVGSLIISTVTSGYSQFNLPIEYISDDVPDSAFIWIGISDSSDGEVSVGTFALIDDLAFSGSVDVDDKLNIVPEVFSLKQNYPNPFNPSTTIEFSVPVESFVELKVYNILGKEISTLANNTYLPGSYKIDFSARDLSSGIYLAQIKATSKTGSFNFSKSLKMTLIK